jgi:hypothetical protein
MKGDVGGACRTPRRDGKCAKKPEENLPRGRPRREWEENSKVDFID